MKNLTDKQKNRLTTAKNVFQFGPLEMMRHIFKFEDKMDDMTKAMDDHRSFIERAKGVIGKAGEKGERGDKGEKGEKGDRGPEGKPGRDGFDGKDGVDGKDGRDGLDGKDGKDGRDGKDGKDADEKKILAELTRRIPPARVIHEQGGHAGAMETPLKDATTGKLLSKDASGAWLVSASGSSSFPQMTTTARLALTLTNGTTAYDTDLNAAMIVINGQWATLLVN